MADHRERAGAPVHISTIAETGGLEVTLRLKPLAEQTIVVTGGSSGIGLTIAKRAAEAGARVVLVARDEDDLQEAKSQIEQSGGAADHVAADVGVREQVRKVVETVVARHGGFDTWVNDAGVGAYAKVEEISDEDHERLFQTNYWGVVYGSTEALKHLKGRGGALINIGSIASDMPTPLLSTYSASKHAVKGFTNSLRLELMHEDAPVSLTLIKPSGMDTPFSEHALNYMDEASKVPPPVYNPDVVAQAVLRAAQVPTREVTVGGAGAVQTSFFHVLPKIAGKVIELMFYATARDPNKQRSNAGGFHEPGEGGRQFGDQGTFRRDTSVYTPASTHPIATLGIAAAIGLATFAMVRSRRSAGVLSRR